MSTTHEDIKELLAPYALGAVDPEEEAQVRSHLRTCDECSREAERHAAVTAALASDVESAPLPGDFVERTLARVRSERPEQRPRSAPRSRLAWVLSGAALLVVAVVVGFVALGGGGATDPETVADLLERPGLDLSSGDVEAKIVATDEGTKFVARGLEPPPEGRIYALWEMSATCDPAKNGPCVTRPAGTFAEVDDGLVVTDFDGDIDELQAAGVTIEDEPVPEPTTTPILTTF